MIFFKRELVAALLVFVLFSVGVSAQVDSNYRLGIGDKIKILVFEEPDMSFDVTVDNSGVITYPYLNEIVIKGKTTSEIESELVKGLKGRVLINPNIAVSVINYRTFSIGGEVKSPGSYQFEPNLNLRKAINLAGGLTDLSNGNRFNIEREKNIGDEKLTMESPVYPGDLVTILPQRLFSIGGEVKKPGSYPFEPNLNLRKAINLAGGLTELGNGKRFNIERDEEVDAEKLSMDSLVYADDVVTVLPRRSFSIGGEVESPGSYPSEANLNLREAINLAGGLTEWSNGKRIKIEREKRIEGEKFSMDSPVYPGDVVTILPRRF